MSLQHRVVVLVSLCGGCQAGTAKLGPAPDTGVAIDTASTTADDTTSSPGVTEPTSTDADTPSTDTGSTTPSSTTAASIDLDGDGVTTDTDCDDADPSVFPGADETCDLVDRDCDGEEIDATACPCPGRIIDSTLWLVCDEAVRFADADTVCTEAGLHLVWIADRAENEVVHDLQGSYLGGGETWIGLHDRDVEGEFEWTSGASLDYQNWARFEPNDFFGEDCGLMQTDGEWNDVACNQRNPFICRLR